MKSYKLALFSLLLSLSLLLGGCGGVEIEIVTTPPTSSDTADTPSAVTLDAIPTYDGTPYVVLNDNVPAFSSDDLRQNSYEDYQPLDELGRCTAAIASIGKDLMPTEERGSIGQVKPTGWQTAKYDHVDGKYLYNRCHLIGFQLTGENANKENLITGTRYLNVEAMLPFENMVADYIKETGNHVLYRVTPIFEGDELVARGVQMEAMSIEDDGEGILFNIYCYNVQPGVEIDYATGESREAELDASESGEKTTYILNINNDKFHYPSCQSAIDTKESNKQEYYGIRDVLIAQGYEPCGRCKP